MITIPAGLAKTAAITALKFQKNSPNILFGTGVAGVLGTVVLASKATLKVGAVLDNNNQMMDLIKTTEHDDYSEQDRVKDKALLITQTAIKISKLYGPALALGLFSIGCLAGSNHILNRRNAALGAAYATVDKAFKEYRNRVIEAVGEEKESEIWNPTKEVEVVNDEGKTEKVKVSAGNSASPYRALFDETSRQWQKAPEYNQLFLQSIQNYANDKLHAQGFLFLNDVYDMLGIERTKAGQIVGWIDNGDGDNYVDFGVFKSGYEGMRFVLGEERSIWLDFNVDGNILDKF